MVPLTLPTAYSSKGVSLDVESDGSMVLFDSKIF